MRIPQIKFSVTHVFLALGLCSKVQDYKKAHVSVVGRDSFIIRKMCTSIATCRGT